MSKRKRPWDEEGFRCPFLDTINRMVLDFDFEKACSVTGNNFNTYACLVCGKYFQGRGKHTQAFTHSLQVARCHDPAPSPCARFACSRSPPQPPRRRKGTMCT